MVLAKAPLPMSYVTAMADFLGINTMTQVARAVVVAWMRSRAKGAELGVRLGRNASWEGSVEVG